MGDRLDANESSTPFDSRVIIRNNCQTLINTKDLIIKSRNHFGELHQHTGSQRQSYTSCRLFVQQTSKKGQSLYFLQKQS